MNQAEGSIPERLRAGRKCGAGKEHEAGPQQGGQQRVESQHAVRKRQADHCTDLGAASRTGESGF